VPVGDALSLDVGVADPEGEVEAVAQGERGGEGVLVALGSAVGERPLLALPLPPVGLAEGVPEPLPPAPVSVGAAVRDVEGDAVPVGEAPLALGEGAPLREGASGEAVPGPPEGVLLAPLPEALPVGEGVPQGEALPPSRAAVTLGGVLSVGDSVGDSDGAPLLGEGAPVSDGAGEGVGGAGEPLGAGEGEAVGPAGVDVPQGEGGGVGVSAPGVRVAAGEGDAAEAVGLPVGNCERDAMEAVGVRVNPGESDATEAVGDPVGAGALCESVAEGVGEPPEGVDVGAVVGEAPPLGVIDAVRGAEGDALPLGVGEGLPVPLPQMVPVGKAVSVGAGESVAPAEALGEGVPVGERGAEGLGALVFVALPPVPLGESVADPEGVALPVPAPPAEGVGVGDVHALTVVLPDTVPLRAPVVVGGRVPVTEAVVETVVEGGRVPAAEVVVDIVRVREGEPEAEAVAVGFAGVPVELPLAAPEAVGVEVGAARVGDKSAEGVGGAEAVPLPLPLREGARLPPPVEVPTTVREGEGMDG